MRPLVYSALSLLLALLVVSCDTGVVIDEYHHLGSEGWSWDEPVQFDVDVTDTVNEFNILIQLRHTTEYPMSNLYMFLDLVGPSGQSMRDTIQFILAEPDGRWIGKGNGKLRELRFMYRKRTQFPDPGTYRIRLDQAMRVETLPVSDVGIRIEEYTP